LDNFENQARPTMGNGIGEQPIQQIENNKNHHPTVKPTDLMQYLCRLITPPNGTILDPFLGSGSTGKAAMYEGFNFVGIELTDEYLPIAKARIEFALSDLDEKLF
jgi:site-specific DNA-methyltransferase (adenine-specific)